MILSFEKQKIKLRIADALVKIKCLNNNSVLYSILLIKIRTKIKLKWCA